MRYYLDTSVVVTAITIEAKTAAVLNWLDEHSLDDFVISDWNLTEVASALSIKLRMGQITTVERLAAQGAFARLIRGSLYIISVDQKCFHAAARFADQHELALRGGDALHLAICADHGAQLATLDRRMHEAALALGIASTFI